MKKILQVIGMFLYTTFASGIMGFVFNGISKWAINAAGWWMWVCWTIGTIFVIYGIFKLLLMFLSMPALYLSKGNTAAKIAGVFPFLFALGVVLVRLWGFDKEYGFLQWIWGLELTATYTGLFLTMAIAPFNMSESR